MKHRLAHIAADDDEDANWFRFMLGLVIMQVVMMLLFVMWIRLETPSAPVFDPGPMIEGTYPKDQGRVNAHPSLPEFRQQYRQRL